MNIATLNHMQDEVYLILHDPRVRLTDHGYARIGRQKRAYLVLAACRVRIPPGYHVHHINGRRCDDRPENLQVLPPSDHAKELHHTEEYHTHISQVMQGNQNSLGTKHSAESVARGAEKRTGQKRSPEAKQRMSEAAKRRAATPEGRAHMQAQSARGLAKRWKA